MILDPLFFVYDKKETKMPLGAKVEGKGAAKFRCAYHNGQWVPESEARVSIFDSGLMYGDIVRRKLCVVGIGYPPLSATCMRLQ
jgi:hypothetical protein